MFKLLTSTVGVLLMVTRHGIATADPSWEEYITRQKTKANDYFETQINYIKQIMDSTYKEINGNTWIKAVEDYIDNFKDRTSFMHSDDPGARLKDPELILSVPAMVTSNGYDCETHSVVSEGYILTVHRIPRAKAGGSTPNKAVILQHGLFDSSANFIASGPEKSLGYVLADAGYDVWMANVRGNRYCREHSRYKTNTKEFWNFSFHEIGLYDMPAIIDYIHKVKGDGAKVGYIGHSMGTTIMYTMLSLRPEYNEKLSVGVALAPAVFMANMESPVRVLHAGASRAAHAALLLRSYEVGQADYLDRLGKICQTELASDYCKRLAFYIIGKDEEQWNKFRMLQFLANGGGASWKCILHYAQTHLSGKFQQFDYESPARNRAVYNSDTPPEYDLKKVTLNTTLFWAENDLMCSEKDVQKLHDTLPETTTMYMVPFSKFNHADYLWAVDAPKLVNVKILEVLEEGMKM
ncbi:lipase 3-like [Ostrinia nubilalis]|uniref:lipase 3-like n=1 Tax=Ostrinia nubilalis TaxID=29057 RepID=UPI0030826A49